MVLQKKEKKTADNWYLEKLSSLYTEIKKYETGKRGKKVEAMSSTIKEMIKSWSGWHGNLTLIPM